MTEKPTRGFFGKTGRLAGIHRKRTAISSLEPEGVASNALGFPALAVELSNVNRYVARVFAGPACLIIRTKFDTALLFALPRYP
jgi:hypothetical protein